MAIEFFDGFEGGARAPEWTTWTNVAPTAGAGRGSGYGLAGTGTANSAVTLTLPATARKTIGFALSVGSLQFGASGHHILGVAAAGTSHTFLTFDSAGHIQLRFASATGTVLATSTALVSPTVWNYLEVQVTVADSGGTFVVRLNGVQVINYTGDTRNSGSSTNIDTLSWAYLRTDLNGAVIHDDIYVLNETDATATTGRVDNTFLGDVKVELLQPNGNGALSQWTGSDGNSTDNYQLVDEMPPDPADYVSSGAAGQQDLWTLTDVNPATQTVFAVQPIVHVQKSDAGPAGMRTVLRDSGGTTVAGPDIGLTVGWVTVPGSRYTTRPAGGAWTVADVNGLQLGVERTS